LQFALVLDWVMKKSSSGLNAGLESVEYNRLCDFYFADDIVLINNSQRSMQHMTRAIESDANKVGLHMNSDKCQVMVTQAWNVQVLKDNSQSQANFVSLGLKDP